MKKYYLIFSVALCLIFSIQLAVAQKADTTKTIDDFYIDFAVPDLGAHTLLGIDAEKVSRPGNTKELGAELLNIVNSGSKITPGIAVDWSPYRTFSKKYFDFDNYKKRHAFYNMSISFGTIADTSGTRMAIGYKWVFYDKSDPLLDKAHAGKINGLLSNLRLSVFNQRYELNSKFNSFRRTIDSDRQLPNDPLRRDAVLQRVFFGLDRDSTVVLDADVLASKVIQRMDSIITATNPTKKLTDDEKIQVFNFALQYLVLFENMNSYKALLEKEYFKVQEAYKKQNWNATVWQVGFGLVSNSKDGTWDSLKNQSFKAYLNGAQKIGSSAQVIALISYSKASTSQENDSTITARTFAGLRGLCGNSDFRVSLEAGLTNMKARKSKYDANKLLLTLGFEVKISDGIWLELAAGFSGDTNDPIKKSDIVSLGSFKYALQKKRRFDIN